MIHGRLQLMGGLFLSLALITQPAAGVLALRSPALLASTNGVQGVSIGANGLGGGAYASISGSGRYVVFESYASDLVPGQVDDSWDVIAHDINNHTYARISTRSDGTAVYNPGDYTSPPAVSSSGRYIAFVSSSGSLVTNDGNSMPDVFLRDRQSGTTLISVGMNGSGANGPSFTPAVSDDGRYVAFQSMASNLVANDNNEAMDLFLRDTQLGKTWPVSLTSTGEQGSEFQEYGFPSVSISGDGRYVAFSYQYLPVDNQPSLLGPSVYLYDHQTRATTWVSYGSIPTLSTNGLMLLFVTSEPLLPGDSNESPDLYLLDRGSGGLERISLHRSGAEAPFQDIYTPAGISDDGRFVVFESTAALVRDIDEGISNIFLRDRLIGTTLLISRAIDGSQANDESHYPAISADGRMVAFNSAASNLMANDSNAASDVFTFSRTDPGIFFNDREYFMPIISVQ